MIDKTATAKRLEELKRQADTTRVYDLEGKLLVYVRGYHITETGEIAAYREITATIDVISEALPALHSFQLDCQPIVFKGQKYFIESVHWQIGWCTVDLRGVMI